jgi:tetratricopeptide (TPR) repeat protein
MRWRLGLAAGLILMTVAASACGLLKSNAQKAADALQTGLKDHAAGNTQGARDAYLETLKDDPTNEYAFYNLGVIAQDGGQAEEAEGYYREALKSDPNLTPAMFNLAILRTQAGDTQEAADLYKKMIALRPDSAAAHLNLGFVLRAQGERKAGDKEIVDAVKLDPSLANRAPSDVSPAPPAP